MFNLFGFFKDIFESKDNSPVGLKRLNEVKTPEVVVKPKAKKEYKLSELMKKTALD